MTPPGSTSSQPACSSLCSGTGRRLHSTTATQDQADTVRRLVACGTVDADENVPAAVLSAKSRSESSGVERSLQTRHSNSVTPLRTPHARPPARSRPRSHPCRGGQYPRVGHNQRHHRRRRGVRLGRLTPAEFEAIMNTPDTLAARLETVTTPCRRLMSFQNEDVAVVSVALENCSFIAGNARSCSPVLLPDCTFYYPIARRKIQALWINSSTESAADPRF